jgi:hypothetical protein
MYFKKEALINAIILLFPLFLLVNICIAIYHIKLKPQLLYKTVNLQIHVIIKALEKFKKDIGRYPSSHENLKILIRNDSLPNWKGPYLRHSFLYDPWKERYFYGVIKERRKHFFYVGSKGKNKKLDSSLKDIQLKKIKGDDIIFVIDKRK